MAIEAFDGEHRWLSNFWPCEVTYDGVVYPSVENAYQAAKTLDIDPRIPFETCSASQAKRLGRSLNLRPSWEDEKRKVMIELLKQKFKNGTELATLLDLTGDQVLIEGNWWGDTYWGICKGEGRNVLGLILMEIRENNRNITRLVDREELEMRMAYASGDQDLFSDDDIPV